MLAVIGQRSSGGGLNLAYGIFGLVYSCVAQYVQKKKREENYNKVLAYKYRVVVNVLFVNVVWSAK
jgi:hypothetical protein